MKLPPFDPENPVDYVTAMEFETKDGKREYVGTFLGPNDPIPPFPEPSPEMVRKVEALRCRSPSSRDGGAGPRSRLDAEKPGVDPERLTPRPDRAHTPTQE